MNTFNSKPLLTSLVFISALFLLGARPALAAEQIITPDAAQVSAGRSQTITVEVSYSTANPVDETLTGLGFRVHFDSTKLSFGSLTIVEDRNFLSQDGTPQTDTADRDGDANTDRSYNVAWTDFGGNWPGNGRTPDVLYRVTFTTAADFTGNTTLRFSSSGTASGYTFQSTPVVVTSTFTPDVTPPVITLLGAATINLSTGASFTDPGATATDNIDGTITQNIVVTGAVNTGVVGTYTLTYNVSDAAGNAATAVTRTVNVALAADTTPPVITVPANATVEIESQAGVNRTSAALTAFFSGASANDARDGAVDVTNNAPTVFPFGTTTVTFTARDAANNAATATATVSVVDTVAPVLTVPNNVTVEIEGSAGTARNSASLTNFFAGASANDARDGAVDVTNNAPTVFPFGTTTVTFTARDAANNVATATATVSVVDTVAPVLTVPNNVTVEIEGSAGTARNSASLTSFFAGASANDARDGAVDVTNNAPTVFPFGTTTVTFTARDAANNAATATATVSVVDTVAPVLTVPNNVTVEIEGPAGTARNSASLTSFFAGASAADIRSGTVTVTNNAPTTLPFGATTVTFNAVDAAGNSVSASRTITVVDTTPPVLSVPGNIVVELENANGTPRASAQLTAFLAGASSVDIRDGARTPTNDAPTTFPLGSTTVTFRVTDAAGNASEPRTAQVDVADRTGPTLTLLGASTLSLVQGTAYVEPGFTATDLKDGDVRSRVVVSGTVDSETTGSYTLTYSVSDLSNNSAVPRTRTVNVTRAPDTTAPELRVPANISIEAEGANGTPRTSAQLTAFFAAASATDDRDGTLTVTNNAPTTLPFGGSMVTFTAVDAAGNTASATVTVTVVDTTAPTLSAPADITVNATGRLTQVNTRSTEATATDNRDATVTVTVTGRPASDNFPTGRTVLTYTARDAAGNTATDEQLIDVNPLAQLGANQDVSEGQRVVTTVMLNGDAPIYPVQVNYTVGGSAANPGDHNLAAGTVTITSGRSGTIGFDVASDTTAEPAETVVITLTSASHAAVGPRATQTINIVEANVAPMVDVQVVQGGLTSTRITRTTGNVTATALVSDANSGDTFTYDWSMTATTLVSTNGTNQSTFVFNPSAVPAGAHELKVRVTDSGNLTTTRAQVIVVQANAPTLGNSDTDGDGTSDSAEGAGDTDGDGIANFQDKTAERELLPLEAPSSTTNRSIATEAGLRLTLGAAALAANGTHAAITSTDVTNFGDDGRPTTVTDAQFTYSLPFFDFIVEGAAPGDTVAVVIPLPSALPSGTLSYRKFNGTAYATFTVNASNAVSSAAAVNGLCPLPRSVSYTAGLVAGRTCLQLQIQDGGPNDLDGATDGRVVDPGSVAAAVPPPPPPPPANSSGGGGGGCAVGDGAGDPTLPALVLVGLLYVLRRRWIS